MAIATYEGNEPYIFFSYAHKDSDVVLPIIEALANNGFRVWYDAGITAGTDYTEDIAGRILNSAVVIAFVTKLWMQSQFCLREIKYAVSQGKSILPIYLDDVTLTPGIEMILNAPQALFHNREPYEKFLKKLLEAPLLTSCRSDCVSATPTQAQKASTTPSPKPAAVRKAPTTAPMPATYTLNGLHVEDGVLKKYVGKSTTVVIPDNVTSIREGAFSGCESLESITVDRNNPVYHSAGNCIIETATNTLIAGCKYSVIPDYVTGIGKRALQYLSSRNGITIPDSVTSIGDHAFEGCTGLTVFDIPGNVTSIGECAFYGCTKLAIVTIPDGMATIGDEAFAKCSSLTTITIPDSVTSVGRYVFEECTYLSIYCRAASKPDEWDYRWNPSNRPVHWNWTFSPLGDFFIKGRTLMGYRGKSATVVIPPDSVSGINDRAFERCQSLTDIMISNGVSIIGKYAFYCCYSLKNVTISENLTYIGPGVFSGCKSLTNITIPGSVTSIGENAFGGCKSLTNITIPDSVTRIEQGAFCGCESLTSIIIPGSVTHVGADAFKGCPNLIIYRKPFSSHKYWDNKWNPDKRPIRWSWKK